MFSYVQYQCSNVQESNQMQEAGTSRDNKLKCFLGVTQKTLYPKSKSEFPKAAQELRGSQMKSKEMIPLQTWRHYVYINTGHLQTQADHVHTG